MAGEGGALLWHQAVDRNTFRRRIKTTKNFEHLQPVVFGFAHAENSPATDRHPGFLDRADRAEPILERVRGNDVGIMLGGSVEIVIIGRYAGLLELAGRLIGQLS